MEWVFLLLCFIVTGASPPSITKTYRTDYVYNKMTDTFYKLHVDSATLFEAENLCLVEGASLLGPNDMEFNDFNAMLKKYPDITYVWVADDGTTHIEAEHRNVVVFGAKDTPEYGDNIRTSKGNCNLMNKFGELQTLEDEYCNRSEFYPFICKIEAKDAPYDEVCDVYDSGFIYDATVGSCYKIPSIPLTWNLAYHQCQAVGSHLVVINSKEEHKVVRKLLQRAPLVKHSHHKLYYSAGFHVKPGTRDFLTIFNQTLEEAGYAVWTEYEPNNFNNNEDCGSLFKYDGKLNDFSCTDKYGYICEKEKPIRV